MQAELNSLATLRPIQILGVNPSVSASGNDGITAGRVLPWLQPAAGDDISTLWSAANDDVIILGPENERLGVFNLLANDLLNPTNYAALKNQLLAAANE